MRVDAQAIKHTQSRHSGEYADTLKRAHEGTRGPAMAQAPVSSLAQATSRVLKQWSNKHYSEE